VIGLRNIVFSILILALAGGSAQGQNGFSIRGGLLYDKPVQKVYQDMESGIGYVGSIGYDIIDRLGLEIGVLHSTHDYRFAMEGNSILEEEAEKNTIFFKVRGIPWKIAKAEIVLAAGPALFDISGLRRVELVQAFDIEEDFSGWGVVTSLDFRYHVSPGLAVTFYLSGNFVNYDKYTQFRSKAIFPGKLPGGDSISWGVTIFHRIGNPTL
jgi:hypothetical protein